MTKQHCPPEGEALQETLPTSAQFLKFRYGIKKCGAFFLFLHCKIHQGQILAPKVCKGVVLKGSLQAAGSSVYFSARKEFRGL